MYEWFYYRRMRVCTACVRFFFRGERKCSKRNQQIKKKVENSKMRPINLLFSNG